jgi:hypothetical protein
LIVVKYEGRLGNNLFQYCYGRILAKKLGMQLEIPKINGFNGTEENVTGIKMYPPIIVNGFFQVFDYYKEHKEDIKRWLYLDKTIEEKISKEDLVVYIRRSDYVSSNLSMPMSFYDECVKNILHDKLYVCTCDPNDPDTKDFINRNRGILKHKSQIDDFKFIMNFNKIVLSQSTYCWWAAWLSDATEIYYPISENFGAWGRGHDSNLIVDESRYKYIKVVEPYKYSWRFFIYIYSRAIYFKFRKWLR